MFGVYLLLSLSFLTATAEAALSQKTLLQDRLQGAVVGSALGDALGRVTNGLDTTDEIKNIYGQQGLVSFQGFKKHDWTRDASGREAALYSGNTVLAQAALNVLDAGRKKDETADATADKMALALVDLFEGTQKEPLFAVRNHTLANIQSGERLAAISDKQDSSWWSRKNCDEKFNEGVDAESDSSALARVWPVGLVYADNISKAKSFADLVTSITHRNPVARAASAALAVGVAYSLRGAPVDEVVNQMIKAAEAYERAERTYKPKACKIRSLKAFTTRHIGENRELIANNGMLTSDMIRYAANAARLQIQPEEVLGDTNKKQENNRSFRGFLLGYEADEAVAAAVYVFVRHSVDLHAATSEAANAAGKSALIASLAGALVGARVGFDNFFDADYELKWIENRSVLLSSSDAVFSSLKDFEVAALPAGELRLCKQTGSWWSTALKLGVTAAVCYGAYRLYQHYTA